VQVFLSAARDFLDPMTFLPTRERAAAFYQNRSVMIGEQEKPQAAEPRREMAEI